MSTAVVRIIKCDRCKKTEEAPTVTSLPIGWFQLNNSAGKILHLCPDCVRRALKV